MGGQAVLEGVMMRGEREYAIAVRTPDGEIAVESEIDRGTTVTVSLPLARPKPHPDNVTMLNPALPAEAAAHDYQVKKSA